MNAVEIEEAVYELAGKTFDPRAFPYERVKRSKRKASEQNLAFQSRH